MLVGAKISLFAVDLERLARDFVERPLVDLLAERPGGRAAVLIAEAHPNVDRSLPAARAGLTAAQARGLFDALLEDRAAAHLYDAPFSALAEVFSALARATGDRGLELSALEAAPSVYPPDIRPREPAGGLATWLTEPVTIPDGLPRSRTVDVELWEDLVEGVTELISTAARLRLVVVGESP